MLIDRSKGDHGMLFGHVARGNSQWRDSSPGSQGLAVFLGPDAHISPNWYKTKGETGKELTQHHEAYSTKPWKVADAPPDYVTGELKQIVGFEMPVVKIEREVEDEQE
jgi:transcriptional regulator